MKLSIQNIVSEYLGTFFLVFAGTGAMVINDETSALGHVGIAITWGLIVMVLIYAIGDVSGAHMNPAVTLAFWSSGRFKASKLPGYLTSQLLGAISASLVLSWLFVDNSNLGATLPRGNWEQSFVLEFILTFLLMFVIMNVSTGAKEKGIMAGTAIGATVGLEAMFAGPICGASMNPARSLAPAFVSGHMEHVWIYMVATTLGALAAVLVFKFIRQS